MSTSRRLDIMALLGIAWGMAKKHRFLWWLGVLAGGESGFTFWSGFPSSSSPNFNVETYRTNAMNWIDAHLTTVEAIIILGTALLIALLYVSYSSRAGLILAANNLADTNQKKELHFAEAYHEGRGYAWRIFGAEIVIGAMLLVDVAAIVYLFSAPTIHLTNLRIIMAVIGIILTIATAILAIPFMRLTERAIVLGGHMPFDAINRAWSLMWSNLGSFVLLEIGAVLSSFVVSTVIGIALGGLLLVGSLGVFAVFLVSHQQFVAPVLLGGVLGIAWIWVAVVAGGFVSSFISAYWTLSYRFFTIPDSNVE